MLLQSRAVAVEFAGTLDGAVEFATGIGCTALLRTLEVVVDPAVVRGEAVGGSVLGADVLVVRHRASGDRAFGAGLGDEHGDIDRFQLGCNIGNRAVGHRLFLIL